MSLTSLAATPKSSVTTKSPRESMARSKSQRDRQVAFSCACGVPGHTSIADCLSDKKELQRQVHVYIMPRVIIASDVIDLHVGGDGHIFRIHKDLLYLHSFTFRRWTNNRLAREAEQEESNDAMDLDDSNTKKSKKSKTPKKPVNTVDTFMDGLKKLDPALFTQFLFWLYSGQYPDEDVLNTLTNGEDLWALGSFLDVPLFLNLCMDDMRRDYERDKKHFMTANSLKSVYARSEEGSFLRKLVADVVNYVRPLEKEKKDSVAWKALEKLRGKIPAFAVDVTAPPNPKWETSSPWDDENRDDYVGLSIDLNEEWEGLLLERQPYEARHKCRNSHDFRAKIEFAHLKSQRKASKEKGKKESTRKQQEEEEEEEVEMGEEEIEGGDESDQRGKGNIRADLDNDALKTPEAKQSKKAAKLGISAESEKGTDSGTTKKAQRGRKK